MTRSSSLAPTEAEGRSVGVLLETVDPWTWTLSRLEAAIRTTRRQRRRIETGDWTGTGDWTANGDEID